MRSIELLKKPLNFPTLESNSLQHCLQSCKDAYFMGDIANVTRSPNFPARCLHMFWVFFSWVHVRWGELGQCKELLLLYWVLLTEITKHHKNFLLFLKEPGQVFLMHHVKHHRTVKYLTIINLTNTVETTHLVQDVCLETLPVRPWRSHKYWSKARAWISTSK